MRIDARSRFPVKAAVHVFLKKLGLDVRRARNPLSYLRAYGQPATILDIGANSGQFATEARRLFPRAMIHSFEPLPGPYLALERRMSGDPLFASYQLALGERHGQTEFHENEFSPSSSILDLAPTHLTSFPAASRCEVRSVQMTTLDQWAAGRVLHQPVLSKIDVQGYEDRVLEGGVQTVSQSSILLIEVSFQPLYRDQPMFDQLYGSLRTLGFRCCGMVANLEHRRTGAILQSDAIFVQESAAAARSSTP